MFTQKFIYFAMVELFTNHTKESHWAIYDIVLSVRLTCNRFFIFLLLWVPIRGWYHFYILLLQTVTDVEENSTSSNRRSENDASGGTTTKRRCQLVPQTERFGFIYFFAWYIFFSSWTPIVGCKTLAVFLFVWKIKAIATGLWKSNWVEYNFIVVLSIIMRVGATQQHLIWHL